MPMSQLAIKYFWRFPRFPLSMFVIPLNRKVLGENIFFCMHILCQDFSEIKIFDFR